MSKSAFTALLSSILFLSCNRDKFLIGTYVVSNTINKDTLFILANGTFKQHFVNTTGGSYFNFGTWEYKGDKIDFDDYVWYLPGYGPNDYSKVYWPARLSSSIFGQTSIVIDADMEIYYTKKTINH